MQHMHQAYSLTLDAMILIDSILMDEAIIHEHFSCDLQACKGACCTLSGGEGAPLDAREIPQIEETIPFILPYLTNESKEVLQTKSWVGGTPEEPFVSCIDDADCVFVYRENGIAKCAMEKAFLEGKTSFRKPLSCHLFPIRVRNFGGDFLSFQPFDECKPAMEHGKRQHAVVIDSVREALIRAYGQNWYEQAHEYMNQEGA
ncbi:MAG: DUF3109 family protein [Bacteroidetes bacterium]|nr:DUF3109 family protein [bacterium]NBP63831.1 DUF3109 family protein [Bacteroidota bacterium]